MKTTKSAAGAGRPAGVDSHVPQGRTPGPAHLSVRGETGVGRRR